MVKQGYVRTAEAAIAIVITFTLLNVLLAPNAPDTRREAESVVPSLLTDLAFRQCVIERNGTCVNTTLATQIPQNYNFTFNLSGSEKTQPTGLPEKRVFASSLYVAGNTTNLTTTVLRVYWWSNS